jgi:hypothetical protein
MSKKISALPAATGTDGGIALADLLVAVQSGVTQKVTMSQLVHALRGLMPLRTMGAITIAASNSPDELKESADYVCAGTDDQDTWMDAINSASSWAAWIVPLMGQHNFSASCVIDRSNVNIDGMIHPCWGQFAAPYFLGGDTEGNNSVKVKASASNISLFTTGTTFPDNTENRHRGIRIANLYIRGATGTTGIFFHDHTDMAKIEKNQFDHVDYALRGQYDYLTFKENNVQKGNHGVLASGFYLKINDNEFADSDGNAIEVDGEDTQSMVNDNRIQRVRGFGIKLTYGGTANSNTITDPCVAGIILSAGSADNARTTVNGNTISIGDVVPDSLGATGVQVGTDAGYNYPGVTVQGNTISAKGTGTGRGIDLRKCTKCMVTGNTVAGTWGTKIDNSGSGAGGNTATPNMVS